MEQNFVTGHKKTLQKTTPIKSEWIESRHMSNYSDDQELNGSD